MKLYQVDYSDEAKKDIEEITEYIAERSLENASSFIFEFLHSIKNNLSAFPAKYTKYKDCSRYPYKNYLVFFEYNESTQKVNVLMIVNAKQLTKYEHFLEP